MRKKILLLAGTATCLLLPGCDKPASAPGDKGLPEVPGQQTAQAVAPAPAPVASHLGIATRVPADADIFLAGYHADESVREIAKALVKSPFFFKKEGDPAAPPPEDPAPYVGDEAFLYVGPGTAGHLQAFSETYRDIAAMSAGTMMSGFLALLDPAREAAAEPFDEQAAQQMLEKWMDAFEKDSRLQLPGVVAGWKPHPDKVALCQEKLTELLGELSKGNAHAKPVSFEADGVTMSGFEIGGREIFGEFVDKARKALAEQEQAEELLKQLSQERIDRFLAAVENLHLTFATGILDGRVLIYFGNGKEGFHVAATPEQSLAGSADLKWTQEFAAKRLSGVIYLSQPMVASVLPWLDQSRQWEALANAVGPPIKSQRLFRDLLGEIALNDRELARRDASAWSAIVLEDAGWRLETRGGWPDPSLDYTTPLRLTAPALAQNPAIRAHWVQNRSRNDLEWQRLEMFATLGEAAFQEFMKQRPDATAGLPANVVPEVIAEIRALNRAYREEFRAGIGDEVALVADFKGELPPIPGLSEEDMRDGRMPRFVFAREVKDRARIDAAGAAYGEVWKKLLTLAARESGSEIPMIVPQKMESDDLVTWYIAPVISGDFMPAVNLNDKLWMIGTSKSMAQGMAKAMSAGGGTEERGVIVEIDFAPMWDWFGDVFKRAGVDAGRLVEEMQKASPELAEIPGAMENLPKEEDFAKSVEQLRKLKGVSYRHRLEDGKPRTSLHVKVAE